MVSILPRDDYSGCPRTWDQLSAVEGDETVRFCTTCNQRVCRPDALYSSDTLGQQALCPALAGPPRPGIARAQFLMSWDPEQRRDQLRYLVETFGSDPDLREGFSAVRSGVRYEFTVRGINPGSWLSTLRTSLRERGIGLRIDPPAEPDGRD